MNEMNLCLLLMDALDAAYRREACTGPEFLVDWGAAVMRLVERSFPGQEKAREQVRDIARRVLWDLACRHGGAEGLPRHFLRRPEAFFRSLLLVWSHHPGDFEDLSPDPARLH
jgi:hypothetical protein